MAAMVLPKGSIMRFNGTDLSEHNRGEVKIDVKRIENSKRMYNGTLRKIVIADKLTWSVDWNDIPDQDSRTVDGKMGGASMEAFYLANPGVFTLVVVNSGTPKTYNAVITDFSKTVKKRGSAELWDVGMTIEEA